MLNKPDKTLNVALRCVRSGDMAAGLRIVDELLTNDPFFLDARGHRAWWHYSTGRYDDAIEDLKIILQVRPQDESTTVILGFCYMRQGRQKETVEQFLKALSLNPGNIEALGALTVMARKEGKSPIMQPDEDWATGRNQPVINPHITRMETSRKTGFPASCRAEIGRFLYSLTRMIRPKFALEIGSFIGYSGICIAQALEDNDQGELHSVDLFPGGILTAPGRADYIETGLVVAQENVRSAGLMHRITFHKGNSATLAPELVKQFGSPEFTFIDGDHTLQSCWADFASIQNLLAPGAVVAFHDTHPLNSSWEGPYNLLTRLKREQWKDACEIINLGTPEGCGLGILQKVGDAVPLGPPMRAARFGEWFIRRIINRMP
ncbi:MAG: class I SAM-dependent methyltransferase [bacterium]|nr:class I SAM-dependent methyltransferase [Candidatus Sumerlaeota bacterium]